MRRKRSVTWFPNVGSQTGAPGQIYQGIIGSLDVAANTSGTRGGPILQNIHEVVQDKPLDEEAAADGQGQLSRIIGQEYILKRVVGSIFIGAPDFSDEAEPSPSAILVTAGLFVARCGDPDDPGGQGGPIGSTQANANENYSPMMVDTVREPWLWRRTWLLAPSFRQFDGYTQFPTANAFYGSAREGTQFDAKSQRRVGNDDRLWLAISAMSLSVNDAQDGQIDYVVDYRVLGTLVKARGKSTF